MKEIVLLGDRDTTSLTHRELDAAITLLPAGVRARWIPTDAPEVAHVVGADGLWVVPGSPYRNDAAVYTAITAARTSGQPFLGTCAGFQYAVIEFARNVAGLSDANHAEAAPGADTLVIDRLACSLVAQERLVTAVHGTRLHALCGSTPFRGFHWCNFGLASSYVEPLVARGLTIAAKGDDAGVEAIELAQHPFFMATLFQPQVGSLNGQRLHPVITSFVSAVLTAS